MVRQRLLIEGPHTVAIDRAAAQRYLVDVAAHLVHAPGGAGRDDIDGLDAFIPLIDSGISR